PGGAGCRPARLRATTGLVGAHARLAGTGVRPRPARGECRRRPARQAGRGGDGGRPGRPWGRGRAGGLEDRSVIGTGERRRTGDDERTGCTFRPGAAAPCAVGGDGVITRVTGATVAPELPAVDFDASHGQGLADLLRHGAPDTEPTDLDAFWAG